MRFYQRSWSIALCLVACSCLPVVGYRSPNLHGRVVDAESNKLIIAATIYLQKYPEVNTSTNERGLFVLPSFQKWEWCVALPDYCLIRQRPELALRKKVFERSSEELLEVEQGDALHRLLPHEMLSLHHPLLRKDFYRRFLDQELIQYSLRGVEEKGKGPMIVCLDGSSSMSGDKEIWSKAVTLTLLDIARKQRRLFRSICFSSADTPLQVLDLNPRDRYEVETKTIMDLAEYFPGGGTDFQTPLNAALECLSQSRFKKGDIIFITDGECQVDPQWAENFREQKEKLGFSLFSILIDTGPASLGTLKEFSDRISTIKQLTGDEAKEIFVKF